MPFTLAHPAAVFPFRRLRALDPLPLIVGSIAPDIVYYFPNRIGSRLPDSHSLIGSFTFCLPASLLLIAILIALKIPLLEPLPVKHRQFVASCIERFQARKLYLAAAVPSILIGVWTHLIWDSFTHQNQWAVSRFPLLRATVQLPVIESIEVFRALQYVSSAVGLAVVVVWYLSAERRFARAQNTPAAEDQRVVLLGSLLALSIVIAAIRITRPRRSIYRLGFLMITIGGAAFCVLWLASGLLLAALRRSRDRAEHPVR